MHEEVTAGNKLAPSKVEPIRLNFRRLKLARAPRAPQT
jgi:hypothetical protein